MLFCCASDSRFAPHAWHASPGTFCCATVLGCHRGVEHREEVTPEGWEAVLRVPWELIRSHGGQHPRHEGRVWRANFYRTDMRKGTTQQEYSAWSTTYQSPAAFHVRAPPVAAFSQCMGFLSKSTFWLPLWMSSGPLPPSLLCPTAVANRS